MSVSPFPFPLRPASDEVEELLTAPEVGRLLKVSPRQIYSLARRKQDPLPCIKVGKYARFRESEVRAWLNNHHN